MKKLILIILVLTGFVASGQVFQEYNQYGGKWKGLAATRVMFFPTGCGDPATMAAKDSVINMAAQYFDSCGNKYWLYNPSLKAWSQAGTGNTYITVTNDTLINICSGSGINCSNVITLDGDSIRVFCDGVYTSYFTTLLNFYSQTPLNDSMIYVCDSTLINCDTIPICPVAFINVPISSLRPATNINFIDNTTYPQVWEWNQNIHAVGLSLQSRNTYPQNGYVLFNVYVDGANVLSNKTTYGASFNNRHTNGINVGATFGASDGTTNVAAVFSALGANNTAIRVDSGAVVVKTLLPLVGATDSIVVRTATGTLGTIAKSAVGTSSTPAGNYGNIQLNRNSAFATPASDSLDWESATGLSVKGNTTLTGNLFVGTASTYDIEVVRAAASATIAAQAGGTGNSASFFAQQTSTGNYVQGLVYGSTVGGTSFGLARAGMSLIYVTSSASSVAAIGNANNAPLVFGTNNLERLRIAADGILTFAATPTTSAGTYDILTRNTSTGIVEKVSSGGTFWGLTGNAGTVAGTNFIGTTDAVAFTIKTNNDTIAIFSGDGLQRVQFSEGIASGDHAFAAIYGTASGLESVAFSGTASGQSSVSFSGGTASGQSSFSTQNSQAIGTSAVSFQSGTSRGELSMSVGLFTKSSSYAGTVVGSYNDSTSAASETTFNALNRAFQIGIGTADNARANAMTVLFNGNSGFGVLVPTAVVHLKAGTATANSAPLQINTGTNETVIRGGLIEYNNAFYQSNAALNRYALGGAIADFITTVNNGTTVETDLYTYTTKASTLAADGEKLNFEMAGTLNDLTATAQLQFYYGGNLVGNTGALTVSATGGFFAKVLVIRTSSSTARVVVTVNTPGASTALYTTQTDITGLTFTNTQIIKITGTAGGASGGTGDISAKLGTITWMGASNN